MYMCPDVACPRLFNMFAEMQCMRTRFKQPVDVRIFVVAKPFGFTGTLKARQLHVVQLRRLEWKLGGEQRYRKKVSSSRALHYTVRQRREESHFRGSTAVSKDTTAQSQVRGLVAGPILQGRLGWASARLALVGV